MHFWEGRCVEMQSRDYAIVTDTIQMLTVGLCAIAIACK